MPDPAPQSDSESKALPVIERPSTRLLILDETGSVLLFRASTPAGLWLWFPPGGGVEAGESYEDAGARELWEETGQRLPLGPHVWTRDATVPWEHNGRPVHVHGIEHYHLIQTTRFDPDPQFIDTLEEYMRDEGWFRWWSVEEIVAHTRLRDLRAPRSWHPPATDPGRRDPGDSTGGVAIRHQAFSRMIG